MLLIMLIAVDFARLFFTYIQTGNAAREAANYAAAHAVNYQAGTMDVTQFNAAAVNAGLIEANVQTQAGATTPMAISDPVCYTPGAPPTTIDCATAPQDGRAANGIGNQVSVTVTQQFTFLIPFIGNFFGGHLDLSSTATATVLNPLIAQVLTPSPSPGGSPGSSALPSVPPSIPPSIPPSAPPTTCTVPNFYHLYYSGSAGSAVQAWQTAGFTGTLVDNTGGHKIQSQSAVGGNPLIPANSQLACNGTMQVNQ